MQIKGFIENSFIDWSGKLSSILFLPKCNFKCPFCQNVDLVLKDEILKEIKEEVIFEYLKDKSKWIDGIVITGGEPTLHADLEDFIFKIKEKKFLVKLDTNGYKPDVVKRLVKRKLIDYVAMDIKTALDIAKYSKAVGINIDLNIIKESIDFLMEGNVEYEFRTTLVPGIVGRPELVDIANYIKNARKWVWQNFKPQNTIDENFLKIQPYNLNLLREWETEIKLLMKNLTTLIF